MEFARVVIDIDIVEKLDKQIMVEVSALKIFVDWFYSRFLHLLKMFQILALFVLQWSILHLNVGTIILTISVSLSKAYPFPSLHYKLAHIKYTELKLLLLLL